MANEHSIRVTARGEFGQLERGLKTLQRDLKGVLGEIDRGARKGGIFDESQLRALDLYKGRFKDSLKELDDEFKKQNATIDSLHRKMSNASKDEQDNIRKQIQLREKELDVIRRKISEMERMHDRAIQEGSQYQVKPSAQAPQPPGGAGGFLGAAGGMAKGLGSKLMGVGGWAMGLAGAGGIFSVLTEAYQKAYAREVNTLDLAQRLRGTSGYGGSNTNMYDTVAGVGRADKLGYQGMETWGFMDTYTKRGGSIDTGQLSTLLKFARGYGLESQEVADSASTVKQLGGVTSPAVFAKMIAASVGQSGMTPRVLEVMQTSNQLLRELKTTFKDTGTKQVLAYQTVLDTIGTRKGMTGLTGQNGANVIGGLGGIFNTDESNKWKWMGIHALQNYNPKKYGSMGLYDLEKNFEDGLMNADNVPAMASYLREQSGGDETLMKRMLQKWLQQGGFNATKRQVDELFEATDGFRAFDKVNMDSVGSMLQSGSATAKYEAERKGQYGQTVLDVEAQYEAALERLGEPILHAITDLKEGLTDIIDVINEGNGLDLTYDFLKEHWAELIGTLGAIAIANGVRSLAKFKKGGGKGKGGGGGGQWEFEDPEEDERHRKKGKKTKGSSDDGEDDKDTKSTKKKSSEDGDDSSSTTEKKGKDKGSGEKNKDGETKKKETKDSKPQTREERYKNITDGPMPNTKAKGRGAWGMAGLALAGIAAITSFADSFVDNTKGKDVGLKEDPIFTDKFFNNLVEMIPFVPENGGYEFLKWLAPNQSTDEDAWDKSLWGQLDSAFEGLMKFFTGQESEGMSGDFASAYIRSHPGLSDKEKQAIIESVKSASGQLTILGNNGLLKISNLSEAGTLQLQELAKKGLISFEEMNTSTSTSVSGLSSEGIARLQQLEQQGLINIASLSSDGTGNIVALNEEGRAALQALQDQGLLNISDFRATSVMQISNLNEQGKAKLQQLQEEGAIHIDKLREDGTAQITVLNDKGQTALNTLQSQGNLTIDNFAVTGTKQITALSDEGSEELLKLQSNGSVSLDGMNTTTDTKLTQIKTKHDSEMENLNKKHETWWDKIYKKWEKFIDTDWGKLWDSFVKEASKVFTEGFTALGEIIKELLPSWLGGTGDSDWNGTVDGSYKITNQNPVDPNGLDRLLKGGLAGHGDDFVRSASKYGIDAGALAAISMLETGNGSNTRLNNVGGLMRTDGRGKMAFSSIEEGIDAMASLLRRRYADKGLITLEDIWKVYSPPGASNDPHGTNSYWLQGVLKYLKQIQETAGVQRQASTGGEFFSGWTGRITSRYGDTAGRASAHSGLDIDGNQGDPIQALLDSKIVGIKMDDGGKYDEDGRANTTGGGTEMVFKLPDGSTYSYSHMSKVDPALLKKWFEEGARNIAVKAGQYVGNVGGDKGKPGSGSSTTGSHLHLGRRDANGNRVDPEPWLRKILADYSAGSGSSSGDRGDDVAYAFLEAMLSNVLTEDGHSHDGHSHDEHSHDSHCQCSHCRTEGATALPTFIDTMEVQNLNIQSMHWAPLGGRHSDHTHEQEEIAPSTDSETSSEDNAVTFKDIMQQVRQYIEKFRTRHMERMREVFPFLQERTESTGDTEAHESYTKYVEDKVQQYSAYIQKLEEAVKSGEPTEAIEAIDIPELKSSLLPLLQQTGTLDTDDISMFNVRHIMAQLKDYIQQSHTLLRDAAAQEQEISDVITEASKLPEIEPFDTSEADPLVSVSGFIEALTAYMERTQDELRKRIEDAQGILPVFELPKTAIDAAPIHETSSEAGVTQGIASGDADIITYVKQSLHYLQEYIRNGYQQAWDYENIDGAHVSREQIYEYTKQLIDSLTGNQEEELPQHSAEIIPFPYNRTPEGPKEFSFSSFTDVMAVAKESIQSFVDKLRSEVMRHTDNIVELPKRDEDEKLATSPDLNMIQLMQKFIEKEYANVRRPYDIQDSELVDLSVIDSQTKGTIQPSMQIQEASGRSNELTINMNINISGDGARHFSEQQLHVIREEARRMMEQARYLMLQTNPTTRRM